MIIAYIHGFCSSSKAKKAQIMKAELLKNYKDIKFVSFDFSDNFKISGVTSENLFGISFTMTVSSFLL